MSTVQTQTGAAGIDSAIDPAGLVAEMADRAADVAEAALTLIDIAEQGNPARLISAAAALTSELSILVGALAPAARAGATADPAAMAAALRARLTTAIYTADLARGYTR